MPASSRLKPDPAYTLDRNLALELVRVTEAAALSASLLMGRGDEKAADQAAVDAMRVALGNLPIDGTVVIGEGERDEAPMLYIGEKVGTGEGPRLDIALDPLEGTTITAKGGPNALAVVALAHLLADVEHGRLVALALADDDGALDVEQVELRPHGVDGRLVRRFLVALADELRRRDRRGLRDAGEAQRQHTIGEDFVGHGETPDFVANSAVLGEPTQWGKLVGALARR